MPAFRKRVLELLEDRHEVGHIKVTSNEKISLGVAGGQEASTVPNDPLCPPPGTKAAFRVCDACAYGLSFLEGTPKCELFWPEKERDRAVAACAAMLRQYGHRFRLNVEIMDGDGSPLQSLPQSLPGNLFWNTPPLHLMFTLLDRPATPDEVLRGDAIFSLAGAGRVRASKMPKLPRNARWTALKDYPILKDTWEASGELKKTVGYEQEGIVWQAEEVEVGGRWQRYYGFVGRHVFAKVPAEEIEFDHQELEWIPVEEHFAIDLHRVSDAEECGCVRRAEDSEIFPTMLYYRLGQPVIFKVQAFNRSGADQLLPAIAEDVDVKRHSGIPMSLKLRYCSEIPAVGYVRGLSELEPSCSLVGMSWTEVPRKTNEPLTVSKIGRNLLPTEYVDCLQLDLNRLFDVSRPGTYRLSLNLASDKNGAWQENEVVFAVTEKSDESTLPVR